MKYLKTWYTQKDLERIKMKALRDEILRWIKLDPKRPCIFAGLENWAGSLRK